MAVLVLLLSCSVVPNSVTLWTVAFQAHLSMGFPRQEYWSGVPFPTAGDLPNPGIKPVSLMSLALAGDSLPPMPSGKPLHVYTCVTVKATLEWVGLYYSDDQFMV